MNAITQTLLAGAALAALTIASAMAEHAPRFNLSAVHAGNVVTKTRLRNPSRQTLTYTFSISFYATFSQLYEKKIKLGAYKWNSYSSVCSQPKQKFIHPKKTAYAKIGKYTETYSLGCASGPTVYTGATYKLTNPDAKGQTDVFVASLIGWFKNSHGKYRGTLNADYNISIGE